MRCSYTSWLALVSLVAQSNAAPLETSSVKRQDAGKMVFAHFMIGIMANRESAADYADDMNKAKAAGIDAFALNIAKDDYTDTQLGFAYDAAAAAGMKVFISFDYNYFQTGEDSAVGDKLKTYCAKDGQLKVDNKCFVSTFNGDTDASKLFNANAVRSAAGTDLFLMPNLSPSGIRSASAVGDIDGAFNWMGWDSNGANRAPSGGTNVTTSQGDSAYTSWLGDKAYMAPVSPWFFTHFASKNWVFPGDLLWYNRWNEILALAPRFIEIVTWNDFGESHYIGPGALESKHTDDGSSAWANNMPHDGWLQMALPYIAAYKAGAKTPTVTDEKLVYWYRPYPKAAGCTGVDGFDTLQDAVFIVAMLKEAGSVRLTSGGNTKSFDAPAGVSAYQVDMGAGKQTFALNRGGSDVMTGTGSLEISSTCSDVNFNAFVGVVTGSGSVPSNSSPSSVQAPSSSSAIATLAPSAPANTGTDSNTSKANSPSSTAEATSAAATSEAPKETAITTPTVTQKAGSGGCSVTITASEQIRPTNCLSAGQAWSGAGDAPSCCDGAACCR